MKAQTFGYLSNDGCKLFLQNPITKSFVLFIVTIDDIFIFANKQELLNLVIAQLRKKYTLNLLGSVKHILGWKVDRTKYSISISQPAFSMTLCCPSTCAIETFSHLVPNNNYF